MGTDCKSVGESLRRFESYSTHHAFPVSDPILAYRDRFVIDDPDLIYLDGNSLGRLPKATIATLLHAVEVQWGQRLIRGWNEAWLDAPRRIATRVANILGVQSDEVVMSDSTSVNLYKLAYAALEAKPDRRIILTDTENFPSDVYLLQGLAQRLDRELKIVPPEQVVNSLTEKVALVSLSQVAFRTGAAYDVEAVTAATHAVGALILWDLSHSVGALPTPIAAADLAVGCTYKHLHGGPGAPAFLYVRRDLQEALANPIQGWFGQHNAFDFDLTYAPASGISRYQVGTPPILSLLGCEAGIALVEEVGIYEIRQQSLRQTQFIIDALGGEFEILTPREEARRGAHVTLSHPEAWRIVSALIEQENVIPDFRAPNGVRLGPAPLYTSMDELAEAAVRLGKVMKTRSYEKFDSDRPAVT